MNTLVRRLATLLGACAATLLLTHCGGVGEDGSGATPPDTYTTGVVNGFGSVVVNGTHFDVRRADIAIDGSSGRRETDLRVGMVVDVTGRVADDGLTGTATRLRYESVLRGTLDAVSPSTQTLQVLGQPVSVDDTTVFDGVDGLDALTVGEQLQISGLRQPDGTLRATFVAREAASGERQLLGFVTGVVGPTVQLAGLSVDIANAQLVDVTAATLAAGQLVRVELVAAPVGGAAVASRLRLVDTHSADALTKQQRQGFVTQWNSADGSFRLNEQPVQTLPATEYQDGDVTHLANGARVEVTGVRGSDGILRAAKVRFLRSSLTAYGRGRVASVDAANLRFTLLDAAGGVEVRVRAGTLLNDNTGSPLSLANLQVGQDVVALGVANGNRIEADLVTRLATNPIGSGVAGPAQDITASGFTLLGVPVTTSGLTSFYDAQGNPMTAGSFFAALQPDDLVRAEGAYAGGTLAGLTVRRVR
ncbi:MAG: hypothetical protein KF891_12340 [Rhizobacter sp.]|nr:hypothetical protein [Rhizobacter sp.]